MVTQILPQTDALSSYTGYDENYGGDFGIQEVDIDAGPTVTFDMGTQGRVDVTPQEYIYSNYPYTAPPKFAYTLLLRSPAVPVSSITVSPSSVTYPASTTSTVTLAKPANDTPVTLSAAAGGTTKSTVLTIYTRPTTAFAYSVAGQPELDYIEEGDNEFKDWYLSLSFSATGGAGTVALARDIPYTIPIGAYNATGKIRVAGSDLRVSDVSIARTFSIDNSVQTLTQTLNMYGEDYGYDRSTVFSASLSNSPMMAYDLGKKGRVEVTATGFAVDYDQYGLSSFSETPPALYIFTLRAPSPLPSPPILTSLSPASRKVGGSAFTVNGTGFVPSTVVKWNGPVLPTTYVSSTKLTASVSASLLTTAGIVRVRVSTPNVGTSDSRNFTVNPLPVLNGLSPSSMKAGSTTFTLTASGTDFLSNSVIKRNGTELPTTFVSPTQLTASVTASFVAAAGTASVAVTTPGVATSGSKTFTTTP